MDNDDDHDKGENFMMRRKGILNNTYDRKIFSIYLAKIWVKI